MALFLRNVLESLFSLPSLVWRRSKTKESKATKQLEAVSFMQTIN